MWTLHGRARRGFCDGVSRRDFLKIGGLGLGGMSLPELLTAEASAGIRHSHKSIIMVFLPGGPPHQDLVDLKPDAPAEIRGEFRPIATNVPGLDVSELMPRLAAMMDKFAVIRSIVGAGGEHDAEQCLTGYSRQQSRLQGGRPSLGAVVSKLEGPVDSSIPPFVGLSPSMGHTPWANPGTPGYLGLKHAPFTPNGADLASLRQNSVSRGRLDGRMGLLASLDLLRRDMDSNDAIDGMDTFCRRAFDILTSSALVDALDVTKEDPRLRARYGYGDMNNVDDGGPCCNDQFLMARRLVEAGVRCVTLGFGRWDFHKNNFGQLRAYLPRLDQGLSALVEDIHMRGLDKDVSVVAWGEFGRTPKINTFGGRDHWPRVSCALLAGGGMRTGQVIGSTDRMADAPKERPVSFQSVFATLYHNLGIDPATAVYDRANRPHALLEEVEPIRELV